jgi:inhibitor of cysteine peptidase
MPAGQKVVSDSVTPGIVGAGSTFTWYFKAYKPGTATITFKYYRPWEGEQSTKPEDIKVYKVNVE